MKNLESSVRTKYDGLLLSVEKRFSNRYQFRASYTLSRSFNYANDDQIPFSNGPIDSNDLATRVWTNAKRSASSLYLLRRVSTSGRRAAVSDSYSRLVGADGYSACRRQFACL